MLVTFLFGDRSNLFQLNIDLKQALQSENQEILKRIDRVAQDVEYRQHSTILI